MCGIVGIWNQADETTVETMARSVAHRGPDELDWMTTGNHSLGASRLSIVGDPTASAVFQDPETGVAVLLNGEIYNVGALRATLASCGSTFHTDLETEVIAKSYSRHGIDFVKHLQGMFAVAILDGDQMVLARDRFGIKPLYYTRLGKRVLFGSEIKALLAHPECHAGLDETALEETVVFGYVYSPGRTLFEGIVPVDPGTVIRFTGDQTNKLRYWEAPPAKYLDSGQHTDYPTAVAQVRESVIKTMDSLLSHDDHRKGFYLSGGLDSTILTLVATDLLDCPVTTFTLADNDDSADFLAAREVAKKLGTRHTERMVTVEDYFSRLPHFVRHYESLVAGGVFDIHGGMAYHLLSETVAEHVKVAFSGEGADELFGGYYWVYTHPLGFSDRIRGRLLPDSSHDEVRGLVDTLFPTPEDEDTYRCNIFDALVREGLANYHLQSVDRSAGAFGFEIRPAFLSDEIAAIALALPIEYKVQGTQVTKRILRDAFRPELERLGLDWVLTREKDGMPAAVSSIAAQVVCRMEDAIDDSRLSSHPLKRYLRTKSDIYLFDLFTEEFLPERAGVRA